MAKKLLVPSISMKNRSGLVFRPVEAPRQGRQLKPDEKPAWLMRCEVYGLEGLHDFLVPTVVRENLSVVGEEEYIGAWIAIARQPQRPGKKYADYAIDLLENDAEVKEYAAKLLIRDVENASDTQEEKEDPNPGF